MSDHSPATGGTLAAHAMTINEMLDRTALQHLVTTYGHAIDRHDYALLRTLYHADATDDHSPYYSGPASGYIDWLPTVMAHWSLTAHSMINMVFLIDGDEAEGVISARTWHRTADGTRDFIAWGRYADRYRKAGGIWRFQHRFFILESSEDLAVLKGDDFGSEGVAIAAAGPADPLYHGLPRIAADRARTNA